MAVPKGTPPPNKGVPMSAEQYEKCKHTFFKPGHVSWNKGKKMKPEHYAKSAPTMFRAGHMPHNHKEVGCEVVDSYGYVKVKIAEPNIWRQKHRIIWEEHNGPVPDKHIIIFVDGNKENCDISNLMLISQAENAILNHYKIRVTGREALEQALLVAKITSVKRKRQKEIKKKSRRENQDGNDDKRNDDEVR